MYDVCGKKYAFIHYVYSYLYDILGKKYDWPQRDDIDVVQEKFIFYKHVSFCGPFPTEPIPSANLDEKYLEFRDKYSY